MALDNYILRITHSIFSITPNGIPTDNVDSSLYTKTNNIYCFGVYWNTVYRQHTVLLFLIKHAKKI